MANSFREQRLRHRFRLPRPVRGLDIRPVSLVLGLMVAALLTLSGCGGGSGAPAYGAPSSIQVIFSQSPPSPLQLAAQVPIIATVLNDPASMGVDWQVSCGGAKCGSFGPPHTASGALTTFTAPASLPNGNSVNITAVSTADATKNVTVTIALTGPPITISLTPPLPPSSLETSRSASLAATVSNDVQNLGVDWTVTCGGTGNVCGSLSLYHTNSAASTLYTAPASVPPGGTVTITAASTAQRTQAVSATMTITSPPIVVTLTQTPQSPLLTGVSGTAIATVTNDASNAGVDWSCAPAGSCGSFSPVHTASGIATTYTAPASVPAGGAVTLTATSTADKTKSSSAGLTISAAAGAISISFTPPPPGSLQTGAQSSLIATVTNDSTNAGVDWTVTCGSSSCGSFALTHTVSGGATTFTAPASEPSGDSVTITATATANKTKTISASVTITSAGRAGLIVGQYAFSLAGTDAKGFYTAVGSIIANGNGNITAGEEDFADIASAHPTANLTGTYSIGNDGRGTVTLNTSDTGIGVNGVQTLSFIVVGSQHAQVIEFDTGATSSGSLDLQTPSSFSQLSITGAYSFTFSGVDLTKSAAVMDLGGVLSADGKGNLTGVTEDVNDGGTITAATPTGTYSAPDSFGRGTATLGSSTFAYYVVNSGALRFVQTDTAGRTAGAAFSQGTTPFSAASLSGNFTFTARGGSATGALVAGGLLTADGNGNLTASTVDVNDAGSVTNGTPTGAYTVASNGRGTIRLTSGNTGGVSQFAAYLTSGQGVLLLELDVGLTSAGIALFQSGVISASTLKGNYAGSFDAAVKAGEQDLVAEVVSDGVSGITGSANINQSGGTPTSSNALTGSYTANSNGRFTGTLNTTPTGTLNEVFYVADASTVQFAETDAASVATGILQMQEFAVGASVTIAFAPGQAPPASLQTGATATIAANVTNDTQNLGVNWTVSCQSSSCGSFSSTHTASGGSTTYTAPASIPAGGTVTITAIAGADPTQLATAVVTIGAGTSGSGISISLLALPPSTLGTGATTSLTANVTNDLSNAGVDWSCTPVGSCGSFSPAHTASGAATTYTAPATVPPNGGQVTLIATATADSSQSVQASITVTASQASEISVSITTIPSSLATSATFTFTAEVTNDPSNLGVAWSVSCQGQSDCGTFSGSGLFTTTYTAPAAVPAQGTVTVTATSNADSSKSNSVTFPITNPGQVSLLSGQYVFSISGTDGQGAYAAIGSVTLDGKGNVTAGEEDFVDINISLAQVALVSAGSSYTIGTNGLGTITLNWENLNVGVSGTQTMSLTVLSTQRAVISEFDSSAVAAGTLDLQNAKDFTQGSITGGYSFVFSGVDLTSSATPTVYPPLELGGVMTADGQGNFSGVTEDVNDAGSVTSLTSPGTYTALDAFGRGTATLGSFSAACTNLNGADTSFDYYVVDSSTLRFVEDDFCGLTAGSAYAQGTASLSGNYAFTVAGSSQPTGTETVGSPLAAGGVFDDSGGSITSATLDVNNNGSVSTGNAPAGTYSAVSNGRGTLSFTGANGGFSQFALYFTSSQGVLMLELDPSFTTSGAAQAQTSTAFASGNYALSLAGATKAGGDSLLGQVFSDGTANLTGEADLDQLYSNGNGGVLSPNLVLTGAFAPGQSGRFTGTLDTAVTGGLTEMFYVVNSSTVLALDTDTLAAVSGPATGILQVQQISIPLAIVFTVPPPSALQTGTMASMTAAVTNDPSNGGVDWSCALAGTCGSFSPAHTASGQGTTYTAPGSVPSGGTVTIAAAASSAPSNTVTATVHIVLQTSGESVTITTQPPSTMATTATATVAAVVFNDPENGGVDWTATCGQGTSCGSFSPAHTVSGGATTYAAPQFVPPGNQVTLVATASDSNHSVFTQSNAITITGAVQAVTVSFTQGGSPPSSMTTSSTAQVNATVENDPTNSGVDWSCTPTGSCGSFNPAHTASGVNTTYTAPAAVPTGGTATIIATSTYDPTKSVSGSVTITSSGNTGLLNGQYAFHLSGTNASGPYTAIGSITADGKGNIIAGEEDFFDLSSLSNSGPVSFQFGPGSTYVVPAGDGRGTMTLNNAEGIGVNNVQTLSFTIVNSQHALITEFDSSATSSGSLDLQSASDFSLGAISGNYAFLFSGIDTSVTITPPFQSLALGGIVTADGQGNFKSGTQDVNDVGKVTKGKSISGTYDAPDSSGRGTASLTSFSGVCGTATFVYYIVSAATVRFMESDFCGLTVGSMLAQGSSTSLSGNFAFTVQGQAKSYSPFAAGGVFSANGSSTISSSTLDVNDNGTVSTGNPTGTYSIVSNGRGSLTFTGGVGSVSSFEVYLTASQGVLMLETDSSPGFTSSGGALAQTASTFSSGNYAGIFDSGVTVSSGAQTGAGEEDGVGQASIGSSGMFSGEDMDLNQFSEVLGGLGVQAGNAVVGGSGLLSPSGSGRYTGALTLTISSSQTDTLNEVFYVVDGNNILFIDKDAPGASGSDTGAGPGTGVLQLQNLSGAPDGASKRE